MSKYIIPNVPAFRLNYNAGDMAILALESVLKTLDRFYPSWWLSSISGDAFKFVYDRGAVFEPMRDRIPLDIFGIACTTVGLKGLWIVNKPIDEVKKLVISSLKRGIPVLASYLTESYHGMTVITGLDEEKNLFLLQIGREDTEKNHEYITRSIPDEWNGPVPGPIIWADNPIFIIKEKGDPPDEHKVIKQALKQAIKLHNGAPLPYSNHPGAQEYSIPPLKGRVVPQSLEALENMKKEVAETEPINWGVIWRMDAQCGQLAYDRINAAKFLHYIAEKYPKYKSLTNIAETYKETSKTATELKQAYWDKRWTEEATKQSFREKVKATNSFVYQIPNLKEEDINWIHRVLPVQNTPWDPAVIVDGPRRRKHNTNLTNKINMHEKQAIKQMQNFLFR